MNKAFRKFIALCTAGVLTFAVVAPVTTYAATNETTFNTITTKLSSILDESGKFALTTVILTLNGKDMGQLITNNMTTDAHLNTYGFNSTSITSLYNNLLAFVPKNSSEWTSGNFFYDFYEDTNGRELTEYKDKLNVILGSILDNLPTNFKTELDRLAPTRSEKIGVLNVLLTGVINDNVGSATYYRNGAATNDNYYTLDLKLKTDLTSRVTTLVADKTGKTPATGFIDSFYSALGIVLESVEDGLGAQGNGVSTPATAVAEMAKLLDKTSLLDGVDGKKKFVDNVVSGGGSSSGGSSSGGSTSGGSTSGGSTSGGTTSGGDSTTTPDPDTTTDPVVPGEVFESEGTKAADDLIDDIENVTNEVAIESVTKAVEELAKEAGDSALSEKASEDVASKTVELVDSLLERDDVTTEQATTIVESVIKDTVAKAISNDTGDTNIVKLKEETTKLVEKVLEKAGEIKAGETLKVTAQETVVTIKEDVLTDALEASVAAVDSMKETLSNNGMTDVAEDIKPELKIKLSADATSKAQTKVTLSPSILTKVAEKGAGVSIETKENSITIPAELIELVKGNSNLEINIQNDDVDADVTSDLAEKAEEKTTGASEFKSVGKARDFNVSGADGADILNGNKIRIEFKFTEQDLNGVDIEKLNVYVFDPVSGEFEAVKTKLVDGVVTADAEHFSIYTVMENNVQFSDMTNHWAEATVETMAAKYVVNGVGNDMYNPDATITRAEFATILVNMLDLNSEVTFNFADVSKDEWYYNSVGMAAINGISAGSKDGNFMPNDNITREDMALMVARAYKVQYGDKLKGSVADFTDIDSLDAASKAAITAARYNGIINGYDDKTFKPNNTATRAEAAQIVKNLIDVNK